MKIINVQQFGGPEVLELIEEADPKPQAGEVLIDVKASGINFADIMAREGTYPNVPSAPFRPGFEAAGVVIAVGEGVTEFQGGDRVMSLLPGGGYATRAILNAQMTVRLPDALDFASASALLVQGMTAYFLLEAGHLKPGQSVLIPGAAGGVGSLAVQIAKRKGAGTVIGLASPSKHEQILALGADVVFDYTQPGWSKHVLAATDGKGINIFLDSQGDLAGEGYDTLGQQSHWLIFGGQSGQGGSSLTPDRFWPMVGKNITLRGFSLYGSVGEAGRALAELFDWVTSGKLKLSVQKFPLTEAAQAHEAIANRRTTGKVVLEP